MAVGVDPADLKAGDLVQFDGRIGEVMATTQISARWQVRVSVEGEGTRGLLAPPTIFHRVETPLRRAQSLDFDTPAEFYLLTEATRLSLAYEHDRLVSLSNSRTKLEPYQVAAVHKVTSAWEQRFLIADDVGLGKTIEVGMILKELKARHRADRILILCPAGLALQWRREMAEKFDEPFEVLHSRMLREWRSTKPAGEELSVRYPQAIVSIDTAKPREEHSNAPDFTEAHWDVVVVDEAHRVAQHGVSETLNKRHVLARDIAPSCDALLLLSATPHDGDPNAFHSLVSLLDPLRFPSPNEITPEDLDPLMVRRGKGEIRRDDGSPLFPPRWVKTTPVEFTAAELDLYNAVTNYVRDGYRQANEQRDTAVGFLMVLLQKRMVSSIAAIRKSLERRLIALEHPEAATLTPQERRELRDRDDDDEALSDQQREALQEKLEAARLKLSEPAHQAEMAVVRHLVNQARAITVDSKARELRRFVDGLLAQSPDEKILIFTEYTDTLDYLRDEVLADLGPIAQIYGGMDMEERLRQEQFFAGPEARLMLATDAAGEGINLQFCHLMINYELPWNPNRIEQRIGRLHRYGQTRAVRAYNLQVLNTREGIILAKLLDKIETIERQLGGYAPNVLGLASSEGAILSRLGELIMDAISEDTDPEITADHVAEAFDARQRMYVQLELDLFMPLQNFDKGAADRLIERSRELAPTNADIEAFMRRFCEIHGGRVENTREPRVVRLRPPQAIADGRRVQQNYPSITFDRETAYQRKARDVQFVAFGHPLLAAAVELGRRRTPRLCGAAAAVEMPREDLECDGGVLLHYTVRFTDSQGRTLSEEFVPVFVPLAGDPDLATGRRLVQLDGQPVAAPDENDRVLELVCELDRIETAGNAAVTELVQETYRRMQAERKRQAEVNLASLRTFQVAKAERLRASIRDFQRRLENGEDMSIAIRRAEYELEQLDGDCAIRRERIESRRHVQVESPELLNLAVLVAADGVGA